MSASVSTSILQPKQRFSVFSQDATIDGPLDAHAWNDQLEFLAAPGTSFQKRLVLYTMSATRLFETALFSHAHFRVVAEFLNFIDAHGQEEDRMSVDGSEGASEDMEEGTEPGKSSNISRRCIMPLMGCQARGTEQTYKWHEASKTRAIGLQSLPAEIALEVVAKMRFSDREHFAGVSQYASDLVAGTLHLSALRILHRYKLCFPHIRLMQAATGAVIAGSTMTAMVATQPPFTSGDNIDIVAPRGKGHAVVDYLHIRLLIRLET
ncbi:hypothetical protein C8R47DRAFT_1213571 [Mycena vitilis]|nr:hypothetical protein C8R47DRAFT_1213571 [Mycena vitilis]